MLLVCHASRAFVQFQLSPTNTENQPDYWFSYVAKLETNILKDHCMPMIYGFEYISHIHIKIKGQSTSEFQHLSRLGEKIEHP